ncbi:hypothetical protein K450DRAFT_242712 [Umbelopsis ramanniana AG]|uniref:Uncharacterized protein n=1 Tax=Umbelopsis ramanniana AG TaxID=1314678 RepID=A0AAD5HDU0_UMBRA|nr:uncharacterized protein K450DRAFT_242712 [Umbelopsis ramanniana AG]KAI8579329.1 hypothetical protein K450DRAFT_242712 [Umbelopsis ramanniana AG]
MIPFWLSSNKVKTCSKFISFDTHTILLNLSGHIIRLFGLLFGAWFGTYLIIQC